MKRITNENTRDFVKVAAILTTDCSEEMVMFTDYIAGEPGYVKAKFESYDIAGIKVVKGTIEGRYGSERFFSYGELSTLLGNYLGHSLSI